MNSISLDLDPADCDNAPDFDALQDRMQEKADALSEDDQPDTLGIPAGVDGLVHEAPGVLRAVSKTVGADGARHQHLLTYRWSMVPTGLRYVILSCNCGGCWGRDVPSCRHTLLADTLLNHHLVKSALMTYYAGQTGPCEIVRAWQLKVKCCLCCAPAMYVHLRRPAEGSSCRVNDRKTVCTGCGLWRHES